MSDACQVDFYLLGAPEQDADRLACRLALMAWERGHEIEIVTGSEAEALRLDELMWSSPDGRFLPHDVAPDGAAPVRILAQPPEAAADVVINLTPAPLPRPEQCRRLLEIVPHRPADREASRDKFRAYRALGLHPETHSID